jgi:hypothetical protein
MRIYDPSLMVWCGRVPHNYRNGFTKQTNNHLPTLQKCDDFGMFGLLILCENALDGWRLGVVAGFKP